MRAVISLLLLLFSMCGVQSRSTQTEVQTESQGTGAVPPAAEVSTQLDVSVELKELRDMVVELRAILQSTQEEMKIMGAENTEMRERLAVSETKVATLERENADQETELTAVKERLVTSETKVATVESENADQETELTAVKERLVTSETKVATVEREIADQETELTAVRERLVTSETKVATVERENADQETELTAVRERLVTSETKVTALEQVSGTQDERLSAGEATVEGLKTDNAAQEAELTSLQTRLADTATEVETLERKITEAPKVAFSAGLGNGYIEAVGSHVNLVFRNIITNVGGGYSDVTGVFTAPVKGVYYFRFTVLDYSRAGYVDINTLLNGKQVMYTEIYDNTGVRIRGSSGLTLQLEEGDIVNLQLVSPYRVFDNDLNRTTFSGFLLFPL